MNELTILGFLTEVQPDSVGFLWLLGGVFFLGSVVGAIGTGVIWVKIGKLGKAYIETPELQAKHEPTSYLRNSTRDGSLLGLLDLVPGLLVSIGILGTFIGLGLALEKAGPLLGAQGLETEDLLKGLSAVIRPMSFKFQVSAWGILGSILFLAGPRVVLGYLLEHRYETVGLEMEKERASEVDVLASGLAKGLEPMMNAIEQLSGKMEGFVSAAQKVSESTQSMKGSADQMRKSADQLAKSSKALSTLQSSIEKALRGIGPSVGDELKGSLSALETAALALKTDVPAALSGSLKEMQKNVLKQQSESAKELKGSLEALETAALALKTDVPAALSGSLKEMQKNVLKQQSESAEKLQKALKPAVVGAAVSLKKMKDDLFPDLNAFLYRLDSSTRDHNEALKDMNQQLGRLVEAWAKEEDLLEAYAADDEDWVSDAADQGPVE